MSNLGNDFKKYIREVNNRACQPVGPPGLGLRQVNKVSQGSYGTVYKATFNNTGRRIAYKKINGNATRNGQDRILGAEFEYKVAKKLKARGFDFVPEMYIYKICYGTTGYLYMEYLEGADFQRWMATSPSVDKVKSVLTQVAVNLYEIKKKIPGFRHHDLHGGNVIIRNVPRKDITWKVGDKTYKASNEGVSVTFIDFGMSTMPGLANPWINNGGFRNFGINRSKSHHMYDIHLFVNRSAYPYVKYNSKYREVKRFIESVFPKTYLGRQNVVPTRNKMQNSYGLKLGGQHGTLPKFKDILSHPFLTGVSNMNAIKTFNKKMTSKLPRIRTKERMMTKSNVIKKLGGKTKPKSTNTKPKANTRVQRMLASMSRKPPLHPNLKTKR